MASGKEGSLAKVEAPRTHTALPESLPFAPGWQTVKRGNECMSPKYFNITHIKDVQKKKLMILRSEGLAMVASSSGLKC